MGCTRSAIFVLEMSVFGGRRLSGKSLLFSGSNFSSPSVSAVGAQRVVGFCAFAEV